MKNRFLSLIAMIFALTACAGSPIERNANARSVADLAGMKDEALCSSHLDRNSYAQQLRSDRGLGDCSKSYLNCKTYGFKPTEPEFAQCRLMVDTKREAKRSSFVYNPPQAQSSRMTSTSCRQSYSGGAVYCNTF